MGNKRTMKNLIVYNTILVTFILIVVIFIISYVIRGTKKVRRYVSSLADSFLPKLSDHEYKNIHYPETTISLLDVTRSNLTFLTACLMSCYNMTFNYPPCFSKEVYLKRKIGVNGYLLCYKEWNIFCFRGTTEGKDIFTDIDSVQTKFIDLDGVSHKKLKTHRGFHSIWTFAMSDLNSCLYEQNCIFVGHSLGGTTAHLAACGVYLKTGVKYPVFTFGAPKVGNKEITNLVRTISIVNENDFIPTLPPSVFKVSDTSCFYAPYDIKYTCDVQTGNIFGNHSLASYSYGVSRSFISDIEMDIIW